MADTLTGKQLQALRAGDRISYYGVRWQVIDYSTYADPKGYETEEWLLRSTTGKEYYLLRERDPASTGERWYIAEELPHPKLLEPTTQSDVLTSVGQAMRSAQTPYPQLQLFNRLYRFESTTEGTYKSEDGPQPRIVWDYWDEAHLWNLALEAWSNGKLVVYSTREVQPENFSELRHGNDVAPKFYIQPAEGSSRSPQASGGMTRQVQFLCAWGLVIGGFFLMMMGI